MVRAVRSLAAALLSLAAACQAERTGPAREPPRPLTYDGATSISNRIWPLALPALEQRTGTKVRVERSGAGRGLKNMFAGQADVAGLARALTAEERARKPFVAIIGYDALGVWVHDSNPVRELTRAQLKDLFSGKITNWRQLGGKDRPVVACTEHLLSERATLEAFRQLALDGGPFGAVRELEDPSDCLRLVAGDPGGVTPATVAYAIPGVRALRIDGLDPLPANVRNSTYLLTRPLLLVAREAPTGPLKELFDFMVSADGQALVTQAGFVAAR
ncbi:MAG TPA: phosphate ABC transporter substrate-binding protein [Anaeromyxobacteraceae bacterium]|nr:phosphate ABC transporter substrate-binding protein [Anaeromyxobacteraceae bacterium]